MEEAGQCTQRCPGNGGANRTHFWEAQRLAPRLWCECSRHFRDNANVKDPALFSAIGPEWIAAQHSCCEVEPHPPAKPAHQTGLRKGGISVLGRRMWPDKLLSVFNSRRDEGRHFSLVLKHRASSVFCLRWNLKYTLRSFTFTSIEIPYPHNGGKQKQIM